MFDESINSKPKTAFNLAKRVGDDQVTYYEVYKDSVFVGYLERHWRYTKSNRIDYKISRVEFEIRPVTTSSRAGQLEVPPIKFA